MGLARRLEIPRESDLTSTGLWGKKDSILKGDKQNLACTMTQGIGAVTPQETEPDLPAKVGVSCGGMGQQWLALQSGH